MITMGQSSVLYFIKMTHLFLRARSSSFCSRVVPVIRRREWRKQIKPLRRGAECNKLVDFSNYCYWRDMTSIGWLSFSFYLLLHSRQSRVFCFTAFFSVYIRCWGIQYFTTGLFQIYFHFSCFCIGGWVVESSVFIRQFLRNVVGSSPTQCIFI